MKRFLQAALKIGVSVLLLLVLLRAVQPAKLRSDLAALDFGHLALLVAVCWFGQFFCAQRWRLFAASLGIHAGYWTFLQLYFVGMLFNIGLPSLVGGDVVKAYMLSRKASAPVNRGLASVLQDRAAGLLSLLVYGTTAALLAPIQWLGVPIALFYAPVWLGAAVFFVLVWKGRGIYGRRLIPGSQSAVQRILALIDEFHGALATMDLRPGGIAAVAGFSLLNSALVLWIFQQVSVAAGHPVPLVEFSALFPLISLVTMLPISLGGIGIREWSYVEGLQLVGVPAQAALAIALASSALIIVFDLAGLLFLPFIPAELRRRAGRES